VNETRVPLKQRRDLGQIIEATLAVYGRNALPLIGIAAVIIPLGIASAAFQSSVESDAALSAIVGALGLAQAIVNVLVSAALIAALRDIDEGRGAEFSRAYDVAFARLWSLIGALLRVIFHVLLFAITIIGIPWAIQRMVRWLFVQQAVILDGASARDSLSKSAGAVDGSWWRTLGIAIVIGIIGAIPAAILGAVFFLAPILVSGTANAFANALILPFAITAMTLLYYDLQVRKEANVALSAA
jgi:hypothetical protein